MGYRMRGDCNTLIWGQGAERIILETTSLIFYRNKHRREMLSNGNEQKTPRMCTRVNVSPDTQHRSRVQHLLRNIIVSNLFSGQRMKKPFWIKQRPRVLTF